MLSFDTETTGIDHYHGARVFFVTTCDDNDNQTYWEWDVDPLTREPQVPPGDLKEIRALVNDEVFLRGGPLVLQNGKFDVAAIARLGLLPDWPWEFTEDTLLAGHALASNQPHDLTTMAALYLGVDIQPYEDRLEDAVLKCRRMVQQARLKRARKGEENPLANWAIAEKDRPDMPSAGNKTWKYDTWLPRAMAVHQNLPADHPWHTVLRDYANMDTSVTVLLWKVMRQRLDAAGLYGLYKERTRALPIAVQMEQQGVTLSRSRLEELTGKYTAGSEAAEQMCRRIAASYGYDLQLPKGGRNKNMDQFVYEVMKLPPVYNSKSKTDGPTLDSKTALPFYLSTLPEKSRPYRFLRSLAAKRSRDTAVTYMRGYRRFWLPLGQDGPPECHCGLPRTHCDLCGFSYEPEWYVLHPSLNPTGSDTLRWSSSNPNEQNISKKENFNLRYCFGPAPGREWWSLDAKNIEARLPAYESGEEDLIALYEEPDKPPYYGSGHLLNFHTVYPDLWDKALEEVGLERVGPHCKKLYAATWYQYVKNGGFAVQYGAVDPPGGGGTADRAFHKRGAHALLKARFGKLEGLNRRQIQFANKYGYVETMPDRTVNPRHGYRLMCSRTERGKVLETVPLNYHIQGTAMWWTQQAMIHAHEILSGWNAKCGRPEYRIIMQVHDELVFDFPKRAHPLKDPKRSNLGRIKEVKAAMERGGPNLVPAVPTPVGVEYHESNWSEGVTLAV